MKNLRFVKGTFTATAGAYSTGQSVGVTISLANAFPKPQGQGIIRSVQLWDPAQQAVAYDVLFGGSRQFMLATDKNAFAFNGSIVSGQSGQFNGFVKFATTDLYTTSGFVVGFRDGLSLPARGIPNPTNTAQNNGGSDTDGRSLIAALVSRGAPTYGTNTLTLIVGLEDL